MDNMKKVKKMNLNSFVGPGFSIKVTEGDDGAWLYSVKRYGKELAKGSADSRQKAEARCAARLGEVVIESGHAHAGKQEFRLKLRYWVQRRPYVVMHVLYSLMEHRKKMEVMNAAEREEQRLHRRDDKRGVAVKLPTHHLAKPADAVAEIVYDCCIALGLDGNKAFKWGEKTIGPAFSMPDAQSHIVVELKQKVKDAKKRRDAELPDDYDPEATDLEG